jgi:NitT/TauT family transport system substrate-binding protein
MRGIPGLVLIVALVGMPPAAAEVVTTEQATLVVGHQPFTPTWGSDVMRVLGLHKKYLPNVEVEWFKALYGPPLVNNMIARKIHMAYLGDMPAIVLASKKASLDTRLVGLCQNDKGTSAALLVPKDSPVKSVRELDGKRVATGFGSYLHRFLEVVQEREKVKFTLVNQPPEVALSNLQAGKIDGDGRWPPQWGLAVHRGVARVLATGKDYGFQYLCGLVVSREYATQHPRIVEGWLRAELETHEFIRRNPDRTAQIVFEAWEKKIPLEVIQRDLDNVLYPDQIASDHVETLKAGAEFLLRNKMIETRPDIDAWVDASFLKAAGAR